MQPGHAWIGRLCCQGEFYFGGDRALYSPACRLRWVEVATTHLPPRPPPHPTVQLLRCQTAYPHPISVRQWGKCSTVPLCALPGCWRHPTPCMGLISWRFGPAGHQHAPHVNPLSYEPCYHPVTALLVSTCHVLNLAVSVGLSSTAELNISIRAVQARRTVGSWPVRAVIPDPVLGSFERTIPAAASAVGQKSGRNAWPKQRRRWRRR